MMITFTNSRGELIQLKSNGSFRLLDFIGAGQVNADVQTQKAPYQDGATYLDSLLDPRSLTLEIGLFAADQTEIYEHRRTLSRVFNPKLGEGILRYEYAGGVKEIHATVEQAPHFPTGGDNRVTTFQRCMVNLLCPNPFWLDRFKTSKQMSFLMGGLSFPLNLGSGFSQRSFRRTFVNNGDVSTPLEIVFYGPAINPVIQNNTTGEIIRVNRTLTDTDKLIIDTTFGKKSVVIEEEDGNRTNVFNWIDLSSSFFQFVVGNNEIEYNSNNDSQKSKVMISYKNRYIGV